jgi:NAD(P)-dependent dehydrogenase (short-subunit alcohol dehydrogenase family)
MELKGKVAIVTGVSKGIGYELVKGLLAKGAKGAGWSRHMPDSKHEHFLFVTRDISSGTGVVYAFANTTDALG